MISPSKGAVEYSWPSHWEGIRHLLSVGQERLAEVARAGEVRRVRLDTPVVRGHLRVPEDLGDRLQPLRDHRGVRAEDRDLRAKRTHVAEGRRGGLGIRLGEDDPGMSLNEPVNLRPVRCAVRGNGEVDDDLAAKPLVGAEQTWHAALRGNRVVEEHCPAAVADVVRPVGKRHAADVISRIVPPEVGIGVVVEQRDTVLADHGDVGFGEDRDKRSRGARFRPCDTYQAACRGEELLHSRDGVRWVASGVNGDALNLMAKDSAGLIHHLRRRVAAGRGRDPVDGVRPGKGLNHGHRQSPAGATSTCARAARGDGQREHDGEHQRARLTAGPAPRPRRGSAAMPARDRHPALTRHAALPCPRPVRSAVPWAVKDVDFPGSGNGATTPGRPGPEDQFPIHLRGIIIFVQNGNGSAQRSQEMRSNG